MRKGWGVQAAFFCLLPRILGKCQFASSKIGHIELDKYMVRIVKNRLKLEQGIDNEEPH